VGLKRRPAACALLGQKGREPAQTKGKVFFFLFKKGFKPKFSTPL
jgi:hypothetical protein